MRKILRTRIIALIVAGFFVTVYAGCFIVEPRHSHGRQPDNNYYIHNGGNPHGGEGYRDDDGNQGKHKGKRKHR